VAIELFWASGSGFSWRVLLTLEHKQLPYQSRLMQFSQGDHKRPEYLALNPRGRVPTLRDGEVVVYESVAMMAYLERKQPEPALFGRTAAETGLIWQRTLEAVTYLDAPTEAFILPLYFGETASKGDQVRAAIAPLAAELDRYEATLARDGWLAGAALSAADFAAYPMVRSIERASGKPAAVGLADPLIALRTRWPAVAAWMARIEALPGYDKTYPPHWRG
jgi:glutathione S-transferase